MAFERIKTERAGAKNGGGAWMKNRREADRQVKASTNRQARN
jgi:hypothetical protein